MLSFIARNGGVGLSGAWGARWALLPRLVSTFTTTAGTPPPRPRPHAGALEGVVCAHSGAVTADARGQGPGWLLRERDGGSGKPAG